jgi:broad-like protein
LFISIFWRKYFKNHNIGPQENPCHHPVVILRDAAFVDVEGLIRYVYRGEVDVQPERLQNFLRTAELLKIKGLAEQSLFKNSDQDDDNVSEVRPVSTSNCSQGPILR